MSADYDQDDNIIDRPRERGYTFNEQTGRWHKPQGGDVVSIRPQGEVESFHSETGTVTMTDGSTRPACSLSLLIASMKPGMAISEDLVIIDDLADVLPVHMKRVDIDPAEGGAFVRDTINRGRLDRSSNPNIAKDRSPGVGGKVGGSFKRRKR